MKTDFNNFLLISLAAAEIIGQGFNSYFPSPESSTASQIEFIRGYGYPVELHEVTTEDGFMLTMMRIPHSRRSNQTNSKPILLMHGLLGQAENYLLNAMNNASLAFVLADNDYDVWLANSRGNTYGRKHKYLDVNSVQFWNFSFHEIGYYDLPAKIDYILQKTGEQQIEYIGHSQGGTVFYVMSSLRPEYQHKIRLASLMAPGGYEEYFVNPLLTPMTLIPDEIYALSQQIQIYDFPPRGIFMILPELCKNPLFREICVLSNNLLFGNSGELNEVMMPDILKYVSSSSVKQWVHFAQIIASGHFRPWDYGTEKNMMIYGRQTPPDYNISSINVPTAFYYSLGDNLSDHKDIDAVCEDLQNCVQKFLMPNEKWNHLDFLFAKNAKKELYDPLIEFSERFVD